MTIQSSATGSVSGGHVVAGTGGNNGAAVGAGLFVMTGASTVFDVAGPFTVSDVIADDSAGSILAGGSYTPGSAGGASIIEQGIGTLVLGADNTFAGTTSVEGGVLRLTGSISLSSAMSVTSTSTLTGNGSAGSVFVDGTIAPGTPADPQGRLALKNLSLTSGALSCFHASGSGNASSNLIISSSANIAGVARLDFASSPSVGSTYTLIQAAPLTGTFAAYETNMPNLEGVFSYSNDAATFTVTVSNVIFQNGFEGLVSDSPCVTAFAN